MDKSILEKIRADSLQKHAGMFRRYGYLDIDTCKQVIVDREIDSTSVRVVFEEHDGYGHGVNVPPGWLTEDHISQDRLPCPRCGGAGKLTFYGIDCEECKGTGKVPGKKTIQ